MLPAWRRDLMFSLLTSLHPVYRSGHATQRYDGAGKDRVCDLSWRTREKLWRKTTTRRKREN